ncbi:unnamed protein product [Hymenolepis diminuta]|nr:unnamed protein product [Hymenolepis diminuta]
MKACWHSDPERRPSFGTIIIMLEPYVSSVFRTSSFYLNQPLTARCQQEGAHLGRGEGTEFHSPPHQLASRMRPKSEEMERVSTGVCVAEENEEPEEEVRECLLNAMGDDEDEIQLRPSSR